MAPLFNVWAPYVCWMLTYPWYGIQEYMKPIFTCISIPVTPVYGLHHCFDPSPFLYLGLVID